MVNNDEGMVNWSVRRFCGSFSIYMELNVILGMQGYKTKAVFKGWVSKH